MDAEAVSTMAEKVVALLRDKLKGSDPGALPSAKPRSRFGEWIPVPADMGNVFAQGNSAPIPAAQVYVPTGRNVGMTADCAVFQKYVAWRTIPITTTPCPQPPVAAPCAGDPPAMQIPVPSSNCCQGMAAPLTPVYPPCYQPCYPPCGPNPNPLGPSPICTSCVYPTCLNLTTFTTGASIICGPAGPVTGPGVQSCNPLTYFPACQDGCLPVIGNWPSVVAVSMAIGRNISLSADQNQLYSTTQAQSDPSLQWVPPPNCNSRAVPTIIPIHLWAQS